MIVRVLFFAHLRERFRVRETTVEIAENATVDDAWRTLCARYDGLASERLRLALNQVYVDNTHPLRNNDELALIPPVSGGSGGGEPPDARGH